MSVKGRKIVALLPMKAESERVQGKNFRDFAGKPLFRWVLDTLLALDFITEVVINTDARHILAELGTREEARLHIRDRKAELCGNLVSMNRIIEDDIEAVAADIYIMTHATNPLLSGNTIRAAVACFCEAAATADSLFAVNRIQNRFYRADVSPINHDPDNLLRTQDLEPWFEENSCLYLFTLESFATTRARIGRHPMMFEMPRLESIDIDEPEDWILAEALAKYLQDQGRAD